MKIERTESVEDAFDPLAASRHLRESGMAMQQAEATAGVIAGATRILATRDYLDSRLEQVSAKFALEIEKLHPNQWRVAFAIILAQVATMGWGIAFLTYIDIMPDASTG